MMISRPFRLSVLALASLETITVFSWAQTPPRPVAPAPGVSTPGKTENGADTLSARIGAVIDPATGLTAEQVAKRAVATSLDVRSRREDILAAAASVDQAFAALLPRITATASYTRLSPYSLPNLGSGSVVAPTVPANQNIPAGTQLFNAPPFAFPVILNQYALVTRFTVPISDYLLRLSQAYTAASRSETAAKFQERAARLKSAADAKVAYYSWVRARLQVLAAEQALEQTMSQLNDGRRNFEAGASSKADVLRIEAQVANNELLRERARNLASLYEDNLHTLMHEPPTRSLVIGEDIRVDPAGANVPANVNEAYAEAMDQRLELRALDDTVYSLREQAKATRGGGYPRLEAVGDVTYANPNQRFIPQTAEFRATWTAGLQVVWSPNDLLTNLASARVTEAKAAQTEAQKATLRDSLRSEVVQAHQGLREAQLSLQTTARGLAAAEESYRVRRELFRNGRATNVEVLDEETSLLQARIEAINARINLRVAAVQLDHAMGRDVESRSKQLAVIKSKYFRSGFCKHHSLLTL